MKTIALAVLAAGASQRFGDADKLLAMWRGRPLLSHTLDIFTNAPFVRRVAILRPDANAAEDLCRKAGFAVLENAAAYTGIASSIALAAENCGDVDGLMIALGDMALIRPGAVNAVIAAFEGAPENAIVAPVFENRRGHPVLFAKAHIPALTALKGDRGAGALIDQQADAFVAAPVNDSGIFTDFDRPEDFTASGPTDASQ